MKDKGSLLLVNWAVFAAFITLTLQAINWAVASSYHPNSPAAPYHNTAAGIWFAGTVTSFLMSLTLLIFQKRFSYQRMLRGTIGVYSLLAALSAIAIIFIKPVPDYFTQSIDQDDYRVPNEFTAIRDGDSGIRLDICLETLTGVYEKRNGECSHSIVLIDGPDENIANEFSADNFFEDSDGLEIEGDRVIFTKGMERHRIQSSDDLKSYGFGFGFEDYDLTKDIVSPPTYLQVDSQDKLVRFTRCRESVCEQSVKMQGFTIRYDSLEGSGFDIERWQRTEKRILDLISDWKVTEP